MAPPSKNEGTGLEEWDDWMNWGNGAINEPLPSPTDLVKSTESTLTATDPWNRNLDTSGFETMPSLYPNIGEYPFEDAPFDLDDVPSISTSSTPEFEFPTYPFTTDSSAPIQQQDLRRAYGGVSSLTVAEEKALQDIAMPFHALSNIKDASPATLSMESPSPTSPSASPEPEVQSRKNNKRKLVDLEESSSTKLCQSRKSGHNAIEKRYRSNLNAKLECLRESVPSLCDLNANASKEDSFREDSKAEGQQKYGKAAILTRAMEYIQQLEGTTQKLGGEVDRLKIRVGAFEKLAMSRSIALNGYRISDPLGSIQPGMESCNTK